ncbi:magnesium transporter mgtE [Enterobacter asburiae]|uniref:Magnesium transporter mgtE n=1 Tax=Enterobacter asburiae TaxID=61645 RepID=A0A376FM39_ENTAS|nr:magnesium transporter mgtE [Enterobacter asburiae]
MPDNTDKLFVTSRDKTLLGELELKTILLNSTQRKVSEVMENEPMVFSPEDDAEKAARTFERDDLVSAAVVDFCRQTDGASDHSMRSLMWSTKKPTTTCARSAGSAPKMTSMPPSARR